MPLRAIEPGKKYTTGQLDRQFRGLQDDVNRMAIGANVYTYLPVKGAMCAIEGNGLLDPTIDDSYNISTVTRQGTGLYRFNLEQDTILGESILENIYPQFTVLFGPPDNDFAYQASIVDAQTGTPSYFDIEVNELTAQGNRINLVPTDLESGDFLTFMGFVNVQLKGAEPLPAQAVPRV